MPVTVDDYESSRVGRKIKKKKKEKEKEYVKGEENEKRKVNIYRE